MDLLVIAKGCAGCCEKAGQVGVRATVEEPSTSLPFGSTVTAVGILVLVPEKLDVLSDISLIVISLDLYNFPKQGKVKRNSLKI